MIAWKLAVVVCFTVLGKKVPSNLLCAVTYLCSHLVHVMLLSPILVSYVEKWNAMMCRSLPNADCLAMQ